MGASDTKRSGTLTSGVKEEVENNPFNENDNASANMYDDTPEGGVEQTARVEDNTQASLEPPDKEVQRG